MSRFFDTLKEVSRSQAVQAHLNGHTKKVGVGEVEDPPEVDLPTVSANLPEAVTPPVAASRAESAVEAPPTRNGVRARRFEFNPDKNAPLMPHTLDRAIIERYRRLRTKIQQQQAANPIRSLVIA